MRHLLIQIFIASFIAAPLWAAQIKVDRVTVNTALDVMGRWEPVSFPQAFSSPPVVIVSPTSSNPDPASVRIRNVSNQGFEVLVVEPPGSDGATAPMTVDYFAAQPGIYTFPGAIRLEVGTLSTTTQQGLFIPSSGWQRINFSSTFTTPALVTQVQTINSQPDLSAANNAVPWLEVALQNVSGSGADIALERAETSTGTVVSETIGYVIMESGTEVSLGGETFQALQTAQSILGWDNGCTTSSFSTAFATTPLVVASQMTRNGNNGGWVRRCSLSNSTVGLLIDEDQDRDSDRAHIQERVGVIAASGPFFGSQDGLEIAAGQSTILSSEASANWTRVNFDTPFATTPLIFSLNTDTEADPSEVRLRNISRTGFDISLVKPEGDSGAADETVLDYIAIEPDTYELENGDIFEVGSIQTSAVQGLVGATGWDTIDFESTFSSAPALLLQVQTTNNEPSLNPSSPSIPWITTTAQRLTSGSVNVALETSQTRNGSISQPETIAYFAVNNGANGQLNLGADNTVDYEMLLSASNIVGWDNQCVSTSFADSYSNAVVVASQVSRNGSDGGWARRCSLSDDRVGLSVDEDSFLDFERAHIAEQAGIFVFGSPFEANILGLDHFAIEHGGNAVTCEAEPVRILAHSADHNPISINGTTVRITASSTSPSWSPSDVAWRLASGDGNFSAPSSNIAEYTFHGDESSVDLWLSNRTEATIDIDVVVTTNSDLSDLDNGGNEDPPLSFANTGFRFYNDANNDGDADINSTFQSSITSGDVSGSLILKAVQTSDETGACEARLTGTRSVEFAYECVNPNTCIRNRDLNITGHANAQPVEENNAGNVVDFEAVILNFDADGEARFNMQYFDAGEIRLHARALLPDDGNAAEITLNGASNTTVVRPANFLITDIHSPNGTSNPGSRLSGTGFVAAGSPFQITAQSLGSTGILTPNFGNENAPESLKAVFHRLVTPSSGDAGTLLAADQFTPSNTSGEFENTQIAWTEVGTLTLHLDLSDEDYLGTGNVQGTESNDIGRFYPAEFLINNANTANACASGEFSYMSDLSFNHRPITTELDIDAINAQGAITINYSDNLSFPTTPLRFWAENNNDGINLSSRLDILPGNWVNGKYTLAGGNNTGFSRAENLGNVLLDGPYSTTRLSFSTEGSALDPTRFSPADYNANPNTETSCSADNSCNAILISGDLNFVFGRMLVEDTHGPESAALPVAFKTEYWNGRHFEIHGADSCTQIQSSHVLFNGSALNDDTNRTVNVGSSTSTGSFSNYVAGSHIQMDGGDAGLIFSAPGMGNTGEFDIDIRLTHYPWLSFDWNQDSSHNDNNLPSATVSFGSYRGHDRIIYWREVLTE